MVSDFSRHKTVEHHVFPSVTTVSLCRGCHPAGIQVKGAPHCKNILVKWALTVVFCMSLRGKAYTYHSTTFYMPGENLRVRFTGACTLMFRIHVLFFVLIKEYIRKYITQAFAETRKK